MEREKLSEEEILKAKERLEEMTKLKVFTSELEEKCCRHHLGVGHAIKIKIEIEKEINSGTLRSEEVENRVDEIILKYEKNFLENKEKKIKHQLMSLDVFFYYPSIEDDMKKYGLNEEDILDIKKQITKQITSGNYSMEYIESDIKRKMIDKRYEKRTEKSRKILEQYGKK